MSADGTSSRSLHTVWTGFLVQGLLFSLAFCRGPSRSAFSVDRSILLIQRRLPASHNDPRTRKPVHTICRDREDGSFPMFRVPVGDRQEMIDGLKVLHHSGSTWRHSVLSAHTAAISSDFLKMWSKFGRI